jgi:hypothetical protein
MEVLSTEKTWFGLQTLPDAASGLVKQGTGVHKVADQTPDVE